MEEVGLVLYLECLGGLSRRKRQGGPLNQAKRNASAKMWKKENTGSHPIELVQEVYVKRSRIHAEFENRSGLLGALNVRS